MMGRQELPRSDWQGGESRVGGQMHGSPLPPTLQSQAGLKSVPPCSIWLSSPSGPRLSAFDRWAEIWRWAGTCPLHTSGLSIARSRL